MPRLRKVLPHGHPVYITTTVEEGIPFPPNPLMNLIIESALARAQALYPVTICHFLFEGNHAHLLLLINNPSDVVHFMERFKTETAHAVNRLLGRKKRTIWCEGYDSPIIDNLPNAIEKIVYTYINPVKDGLIDSIDEYPGLSTWKIFVTKKGKTKKCAWIRRKHISALNRTKVSLSEIQSIARELSSNSEEHHSLKVDPDVWMTYFGINTTEERSKINKQIEERVYAMEDALREERNKQGRSTKGPMRLMLTPLDTPFEPINRSGKRTWCICSDIERRREIITSIKAMARRAEEVYRRWKVGDYSVPFPLGLFPPSMPKLGESLALMY